jgi:hypothetical protein
MGLEEKKMERERNYFFPSSSPRFSPSSALFSAAFEA